MKNDRKHKSSRELLKKIREKEPLPTTEEDFIRMHTTDNPDAP
tara:strand:+ start:1131 stop:1259 length:129 start_codon:yes stop_codon:yes gene_type:complete